MLKIPYRLRNEAKERIVVGVDGPGQGMFENEPVFAVDRFILYRSEIMLAQIRWMIPDALVYNRAHSSIRDEAVAKLTAIPNNGR